MAASAAPFLLTTAPTRTSSCWGERQDERGRRSGQPHTPTSAVAAPTGADAPVALLEEARTAVALLEEARMAAAFLEEARTAVVLLEEARTATVADESMESTAFTGSVALSPWIGTVVTTGSGLSSGTSAPAVGGLPSLRPTTSSGLR